MWFFYNCQWNCVLLFENSNFPSLCSDWQLTQDEEGCLMFLWIPQRFHLWVWRYRKIFLSCSIEQNQVLELTVSSPWTKIHCFSFQVLPRKHREHLLKHWVFNINSANNVSVCLFKKKCIYLISNNAIFESLIQ